VFHQYNAQKIFMMEKKSVFGVSENEERNEIGHLNFTMVYDQ
jgi:hypothetical protein